MIGYRRIGVVLALAGLSAAAGAALWDHHRPVPAETLVMLSACGLVPAPEPVALPLATLFADDTPSLAAGLSLGPILHVGLDAPLWVRFEGRSPPDTADGDPLQAPDLQPHMANAVLVIPVARDRVPGAIRLGCRHGHVAEIRVRHDGQWHPLPVRPDPKPAGSRPGDGTGARTDPNDTENRVIGPPAPAGTSPPEYTATLAGD